MKKLINTTVSAALILILTLTLSACGSIGVNLKLNEENKAVTAAVVPNNKQVNVFPSQQGITEETDETDIIKYSEIARNSNSILYADTVTGHFALQNINTEEIWYDVPNNTELDDVTSGTERMEVRSQLLLRFILKEEESTVSSYKIETSQSCVRDGNVTTELIDNGIKVVYCFENSGISVPVKFYLTDNAFRAEIVTDEIDEGDISYLIGINLLPVFGAGDRDGDGYIFIPDGSGALVDFKYHGDMQVPYESTVYGEEKAVNQESKTVKEEQVKLPVFGTVKGDDTLMGIITDGDTDASVTAIYYSDTYGYTAVSSVFNYRVVDTKTMFAKQGGINSTLYRVSDIHATTDLYAVEYSLLDGKNSGYVGMAAKYRDYLNQNGLLEQNVLSPSFNLEMYGAADLTTSFLGFKYSSTKVLTTFSQAEDIVLALKDKGIDNISIRYKGFSGDGILNKKINTSASPMGKLGSKNELFKLCDSASVFPDYDLIQIRKGGNGLSVSKDILHTVFDYKAPQVLFLHSTGAKLAGEDDVWLLNGQAILGSGNKLINSHKKAGYKNVSLSMLGSNLYSNFASDKAMYRDETVKYILETIKNFSEITENTALDGANAYTLKYADKIWNAPIYSSGYDIFKKDVPFYQLVTHGSITLTSPCVIQSEEPRVTVLKAVETGSELMFGCTYDESTDLIGSRYEELYSTCYKNWLNYAAEVNEKYAPLLEKIYDKQIINHYELIDGVFVTEYSTGIKVAVNYNESPVILPDGSKLDALDYCQMNGGAENE